MKNRAVLFFPPYTGTALGPPMSLLSLAAPLEEAGYEVRLIDAAIEPNYLQRIADEIKEACCFGVSLLTGPMILPALEASELVRRLSPGLPLVFGGWHPTLLPDQTLRDDCVDVIVRGQGERTFVELVRSLEKGDSLAGVTGVSFKDGRRVVHNP